MDWAARHYSINSIKSLITLCFRFPDWIKTSEEETQDVEEETDSSGAKDRRHGRVWERQEGAGGLMREHRVLTWGGAQSALTGGAVSGRHSMLYGWGWGAECSIWCFVAVFGLWETAAASLGFSSFVTHYCCLMLRSCDYASLILLVFVWRKQHLQLRQKKYKLLKVDPASPFEVGR